MVDSIRMDELSIIMKGLKNRITNDLSDVRLIKLYTTIVDGFIRFCRNDGCSAIAWDDCVYRYYKTVTGAIPYKHPGSKYLLKKARAVLLIRDSLNGKEVRRLFRYNTIDIPETFKKDVANYAAWMSEQGNSSETIKTRIGRIKLFLVEMEKAGCTSLGMLTVDLFVDYISGLQGRYSPTGKSNILYTLRNFFTCPHTSKLLKCDITPFLTNLRTNKNKCLESFYTPEEIRKVLNVVNRTTAAGKMLYAMMLLACVYGLRSYDVKTLKISSIDWSNNRITINQHKTKHYLQLPLIKEVKFALLDYMKNARPSVADRHVFIKLRAPHKPYSDNNHFSAKVRHCFILAGVNTKHKHAGLHSMRHSLASSLMNDETPINEVATILGHTSIQSTMNYIWSDISQLKSVALEVPAYDY